jgi:hypothetical protein
MDAIYQVLIEGSQLPLSFGNKKKKELPKERDACSLLAFGWRGRRRKRPFSSFLRPTNQVKGLFDQGRRHSGGRV